MTTSAARPLIAVHRPIGTPSTSCFRTVRCVSGTVELAMSCEPAFDYHRARTKWEYSGPAYGEAIATAINTDATCPTLKLTTDLRLGLEGREARARTRLVEGDDRFVALSWSKRPAPQNFTEAAQKMWATSECWRQWINIGSLPRPIRGVHICSVPR